MSFGLPMPFALERGNVLLICFTCLVLAYGPLVRSARLRWLFAGLAVNFKVYLIGTVFALLLRRRWLAFEGSVLASILVYLASYVIVGEGTPAEIYNNITAYADQFQSANVLDLWYSSSLIPMRGLLEGTQFPVINYISSDTADLLLLIVRTIMAAVSASVIIAAILTWWRPNVVPMHRLVFLTIGLAVTSSEAGGYTQMLLLFFVFMEAWRGVGRITAIVIAYILCIPLEVPLYYVPPIVRDSYLSGHQVIAQYSVGLGNFLRPMFVSVMVVALSLVTIWDVIRDYRGTGGNNLDGDDLDRAAKSSPTPPM